MSVTRKLVIIVTTIVLISFLISMVITRILFERSFIELEKRELESDMTRVINSLSSNLGMINKTTGDWAAWDEIYQYALGNNPDFPDRNITKQSFFNNDINFLIIFDNEQNLLFEKGYDLTEGNEITVPEKLGALVKKEIPITSDGAIHGSSGLVLLPDYPCIVAIHPILTGLLEGPSSGILVFGKSIDNPYISELASVTNVSISVWPENDPGIANDLTDIKNTLVGEDITVIRPINRDYIAGYTMMNDITGNPAIILKVTMSRDIYNQGQVTLLFAVIAIAFVGLLGGALFIYLIRKAVFSRFSMISGSISAIGTTGDVSQRISVGGSDEITSLANNFNNMLDKIGETETQLISQEKRFDRLLTYSPNTIIVVDDQNNLILVNKAFCSLFNITESKAIGKNLSSFIPTEEIAAIEPLVNPSEGSVSMTEIRLKIGSDDKRFAITIITLSPGEYLLIGRDITREREEQERLYLNDRLASIGEMAAGIAHELNNPLTGIVMLSQLLMQSDFPDEVKNDIKDINSEAIRATDVVRNLLAFARKQPPARRLTQINKIAADVLKLRHYEQSVNNIEVITKLHPDLPEIFVDNVQIQQVFLNLVLNAEYSMIHTHKKGKLLVESTISGGKIIVSFTDDGEGIKEENLKKLFQPFFTTKEVGVGTGLGLSLCYGIVHRHGGALYASSKYGSWATFTVELPIDEPDIDESVMEGKDKRAE